VADEQYVPYKELWSPLLVPPGLGTMICAHLLPFQCRTVLSVGPGVLKLPEMPTAQQFEGDAHVRAISWLLAPVAFPAGSGVLTVDHFLPFQSSDSFRKVDGLDSVP
jgi:hypothetical protein